jgi:predicted transglutaminase-like cysteine proteinase
MINQLLTRLFFLSLLSAASLGIGSFVFSSFARAQPAQAAQAANGERGIFNSREMRRTNIAAFNKWTAMLSRREGTAVVPPRAADRLPDPAQIARLRAGECKPNPAFSCDFVDYSALLERLRKLTRAEQLVAVNDAMNRARYITDQENWGISDYWAALSEFLRREGDCEDYAIAKYMALKALGWDTGLMRVIVVQDENLGVPHAILEVRDGAKRWILDNQISVVIPDTAIAHYRPIFSINEQAWWLHQTGLPAPTATR